jgi:rRNA maturation RNase YbeY
VKGAGSACQSLPALKNIAKELCLRNRQRSRSVDLPLLREIALVLLQDLIGANRFELGVYLVDPVEMTRLNEAFLHHAGSTDVITFNYASEAEGEELHGEIFICIAEAVAQARRFRVTWQHELVRYVVHGILHLLGHDDADPAARRKMKREENRLVRQLARRFVLPRLARKEVR